MGSQDNTKEHLGDVFRYFSRSTRKKPMAATPVPYDLTHTIAPFLDRHLVLPLLEFLQKGRCDEKQILQAKLDLLSKTNMLDFALEVYRDLTKDQTSPGMT